jgi:hypothetical protein
VDDAAIELHVKSIVFFRDCFQSALIISFDYDKLLESNVISLLKSNGLSYRL